LPANKFFHYFTDQTLKSIIKTGREVSSRKKKMLDGYEQKINKACDEW
jgi:hypothetical protein